MTVFDYNDYKLFFTEYISTKPKKGRGILASLAKELRVHPVVISQIFRGLRDLTPEQTLAVCRYFGFSRLERDYILVLVQKNRAATQELKEYFQNQLEEIKEKSQDLQQRLPKDQVFSETSQAVFYSNWFFSAIRLATDIPKLRSRDQLAHYLDLPLKLIDEVLEFLIQENLCVEKDGRIQMGPQRTHLGADSKWVARHHSNWRIQGLTRLNQISKKDLFYTGPMALSEKARDQIRKELVNLIETASSLAVNSTSETLSCLNLDWFQVSKDFSNSKD